MDESATSERLVQLREFSQRFYDEHEFLSWIGVDLEDLEHGRAVLSIPYGEHLVNPSMLSPGTTTFHGGVIATIIDTAGGTALRSTFEEPREARMTTVDLDVRYLRAVRGDVTCTVEVVRAGGVIGVVDAVVESTDKSGDTKEVAVGQGTYRLFRDGRYGLA